VSAACRGARAWRRKSGLAKERRGRRRRAGGRAMGEAGLMRRTISASDAAGIPGSIA
jgi:hypothetical protein